MFHLGIRTNIKKAKEKIHYKKIIWEHNFDYYMPKKYTHKKFYKKTFGKNLNIRNPIDFNEKLQYLMIYKIGKKEGYLSDKIKVKEYIKNKNIKGLFVPKTLKIYKSVDDININELPDKFVLKCNHASGDVIICNNKKEFNINEYKPIIKATLNKNFAKKMYEYHYGYIKPCCYAEEYLEDSLHHKNPIDYKIYCSMGKAKSILVCSERDTGLKLSEYDTNWKKMNCVKHEYEPKKDIPKPKKLKDIIRIAEELSADIPFVRVDLYEIKDKIYFGEFTFTPAAGTCYYYTDDGMKLHGDYINLDLYK